MSKDLSVLATIATAILAIVVWMNYADVLKDFVGYTSTLSSNQRFQMGLQGFNSMFQPVSFFNQSFPLVLILLLFFGIGALWQKSR